ncbi:disease resistance protein RUN1 [Trifolium repens]|nr:disease resistance protein RUN1 [Trifolium repens]
MAVSPTPTTHTNSLHSLYSLYCLREVDVSFCGLNQFPVAIGCLRQLERLNLGGNNFVSLPSLNELSNLVYLNLKHCMFLESLPQLPFPAAMNWDLIPSNNFLCNIGLDIFNCPKLDERGCIMAFSWMTQFIQENQQFSGEIDIVIPRNEIPSWFNNQSEGDRILIDNSSIKYDIKNDIIGFVCCSVFSMEPIDPISTPMVCSISTKLNLNGKVNKLVSKDRGNYLSVFGDLITVKTNHIWLTYFPRKLSWYVPDFQGAMDVKFDYVLSLL